MESVHELATAQTGGPRTHLELLQDQGAVVTVRCPSCKGLRSVVNKNRNPMRLCPECRKGNVVPRTRFHNFWLERYSLEEIRELGRAIWG